eukprot:15476751-Alexandrium_andersonii.AAC.1
MRSARGLRVAQPARAIEAKQASEATGHAQPTASTEPRGGESRGSKGAATTGQRRLEQFSAAFGSFHQL